LVNSYHTDYYQLLGRVVFENVNTLLLENKREVCYGDILVQNDVLQVVKWSIVEILVRVED
jgi:RNase P/RNase MRP subunit p29